MQSILELEMCAYTCDFLLEKNLNRRGCFKVRFKDDFYDTLRMAYHRISMISEWFSQRITPSYRKNAYPGDIEGYATEMRQRWARDFTVPFPVWPHPSWFKLELTEAGVLEWMTYGAL